MLESCKCWNAVIGGTLERRKAVNAGKFVRRLPPKNTGKFVICASCRRVHVIIVATALKISTIVIATARRVAGFEGVALMDGMGATGDSQIPGGFYAKVGHDLAEGGEHAVVGGNLTVCHSQCQVLL